MNAPPRSANQRLKDAYGRMLAASLGRAALMHVLAFQFVAIPVPEPTYEVIGCLLIFPSDQSLERATVQGSDLDSFVAPPTELHIRRES